MLKGKKIFYETRGTGATTLLMIHGWACDHTFFEAQLAALSKTYRVIAIDLPGHGRSPPLPDDAELADMAAPIESLLDGKTNAAAVAPVHIIGHSLGGRVALRLLGLRPDLVRKVSLLDISPGPICLLYTSDAADE